MLSNNKNRLLLFGLLVSLFVFYCYLGFQFFNTRLPISPDESQNFFFSKLLAHNYSLEYSNPFNSQFNQKIFGARQYVEVGDKTVPSVFLGYIVILAMFRFAGDQLLYISGPVLSIVTLIYSYRLFKYFFRDKGPLVFILLLGTFPPFIYWTISYFNNVAELPFLIGGFYYLITAERNKSKGYILSLIFFSIAIWARYSDLILISPIVFLVLYVRKDLRKIWLILITSTVFFIPLIVSNYTLFGSIFIYGENSTNQLVYPTLDPNIPKEVLPLVPFRSFKIFLNNLWLYLLSYIPLYIYFAVLGFIRYARKNKTNIKLATLILLTAVLWAVYYLGGAYQGYGDTFANLNASYIRYLLITYLFLIFFSSYFISRLKSRQLVIAMTLLLVVISIKNLYSSHGLTALDAQILSSQRFLTQVEEVTPPDSVIFVKGADKILFPYRNTALYQVLSTKESQLGQGMQETLDLMKDLLDNGHNIYLLNEDQYPAGAKVSDYLQLLNQNGLKILKYYDSIQLYQISKT